MIHKNIFYGWWVLAVCMVLSFYVAGTTAYGFTALFEPLIASFGWSYTQISLAASLRGMEMGIFAPMVGWLVDRYGSRRLIIFGIPIMSCGFFLMGATQNLLMFYVAMFIISLGKGACASVVTMSAVANWFHKKIGFALGILASGFGLSGLAIPLIVWLIDVYGWRAALYVLGCSTLIVGVPIVLIVRNRPEDCGLNPDGVSSVEQSSSTKKAAGRGDDKHKKKGFYREAFRNPSFVVLCVTETVRICVMSSVMIHIMPYLASRGIDRVTAGLIAGAIPLVSVVGRFSFGWLSDLLEKRWLMAAVLCLTSAGLIALNFISDTGMLFAFLVLFPIGTGGGMVLRGTIVREYFGRNNFGKTIGMVMGISAWGGVIGPTLAGVIYDLSNSYSKVWISYALLMALAILLVRFFRAPCGS